jgi:hypothetical protein
MKSINTNEKYKKYLPSKKFTYVILSFIGISILFFIVSTLFFGKTSFLSKKNGNELAAQKVNMNQLLQKDSDGDGLMDWEEGLWGTDPHNTKTFNDTPDAEYVKSKREALQTPGGSGLDTSSLTETDKFAQQFFASLAALKQSGQFDKNTIQNMSSALGEAIANPTLIDAYSEQDIKTNLSDTSTTQESYYLKIGSLFENYKNKGVGDELDIVGSMAVSGTNAKDPALENKLTIIANAYQEYSQKVLAISVPESLSSYHLRIVNSSNNTGIAVRNMIKISGDPIVGLSGVAQYKKYSDELVKAVGDLETVLTNNGILN